MQHSEPTKRIYQYRVREKGIDFSSFFIFQKNNESMFQFNLAATEKESAIGTPTLSTLKQEPSFHSLEESLECNKLDYSFYHDYE